MMGSAQITFPSLSGDDRDELLGHPSVKYETVPQLSTANEKPQSKSGV
jgi:hypothetical protein